MTATTQPLSQRLSWLIPTVYILFLLLPIYWLVNMSFKDDERDPQHVFAVAAEPDPAELYGDLHRSVLVQGLYQLDHLCAS